MHISWDLQYARRINPNIKMVFKGKVRIIIKWVLEK
jgi:hypothetical protein